ncbi:hypothetical protein C1W90_06740 [Burkholderia pseudomallei]|uniref:Uncharacterized protein n=1 Tax=Burkholderia pseudomallei TaxID=28450 RepID=A0AAX0UBN6_BURPE|nr:hypothetical protein BHT10_21000 [Burkholderia pseudomallei]AYX09212.1 hypothetical protein EGY14_27485 [Burkholderia pseudomallei]AYX30669.1 hypothetical protein EGY16_13850 [Burkholderia pseudomallei]MUU83242.1 hypothetical protein [Burkholderia pseudomallei]MXK54958.1 hypothetical protein [Burkholderia pseudomallei]
MLRDRDERLRREMALAHRRDDVTAQLRRALQRVERAGFRVVADEDAAADRVIGAAARDPLAAHVPTDAAARAPIHAMLARVRSCPSTDRRRRSPHDRILAH